MTVLPGAIGLAPVSNLDDLDYNVCILDAIDDTINTLPIAGESYRLKHQRQSGMIQARKGGAAD